MNFRFTTMWEWRPSIQLKSDGHFQIVHHDFLGEENKLQTFRREYSCKSLSGLE